MDGQFLQFSGGHAKWAPETTEAEVENYRKIDDDTFDHAFE